MGTIWESYTCENWKLETWRDTHVHKSPEDCISVSRAPPLSVSQQGRHPVSSSSNHWVLWLFQTRQEMFFHRKKCVPLRTLLIILKPFFLFYSSYLFLEKKGTYFWVTWVKEEGVLTDPALLVLVLRKDISWFRCSPRHNKPSNGCDVEQPSELHPQ